MLHVQGEMPLHVLSPIPSLNSCMLVHLQLVLLFIYLLLLLLVLQVCLLFFLLSSASPYHAVSLQTLLGQ